MKAKKILFLISMCFLFTTIILPAQSRVTDLACEHLTDPLGIDASYPRLSWKMNKEKKGARQIAWQIFVDSDSMKIVKGAATTWNTGKTSSDKQLIVYAGRSLQPFTKYYWAVKVWDEEGKAIISKVSTFETGMMQMKNWKGQWIKDSRYVNLKPAPLFRKAFSIDKKIVSARAYIAVAGLYELYINGNRIGNHFLDPMFTRFDRRTLYVTYDVTNELKTGNNAVGVLLGNGWYNHQSESEWFIDKAPWRSRPIFCLDIRISFSDGSIQTISTGDGWKTTPGPLLFNSIYSGEQYDARKEEPHWNEPAFDDKKWSTVAYRGAPSQQIVAQSMNPITGAEKILPVSMNKINDTDYVFDLGRNIAGISVLKINGAAGTVIKAKHGERLYSNGKVDVSNIDIFFTPADSTDLFATDTYILKGDGNNETVQARFAYYGFQYVEVTSSKPINLTKESLTGIFMHSDVPKTGGLNSSNPTLNKLWAAANNSYLSNLMGYPTDCPQREKNGWTGDVHLAVETGLYNFDGITVYEKWLADLRDEQNPNGMLPGIVPSPGWGYVNYNNPDWISVLAILPWNIYLFDGDSKPLLDCYAAIKRYVDHVDETYPSGLVPVGLGDREAIHSKAAVELTSTVYFYEDALILANAAKLFKQQADYEKYSALAVKIKSAFNQKFYHKNIWSYGSGYQTELSAALYWGLVPDEDKARVAATLAESVSKDSVHLDIGVLGNKTILNALSENGYAELAYQLISKETYPSWGYWMVKGMTTLPENWNMQSSMNHIFLGEISAWMYKALGGIKPDPAFPGFKNILLHPYFVSGLDHFSAEHESPYGTIHSSWKREGDKIMYTVTVPANATATITLDIKNNQSLYKDGTRQTVRNETYHSTIMSGTYQFEIK